MSLSGWRAINRELPEIGAPVFIRHFDANVPVLRGRMDVFTTPNGQEPYWQVEGMIEGGLHNILLPLWVTTHWRPR